jgi:hypothetical protein
MAIPYIVHDTPAGYVRQDGRGLFRVYQHTSTHAELIGTYHFPADEAGALSRAKARLDGISKDPSHA